MHLIEKISNRFAEKISLEMEYDQDKKEVIAYGTYAILQISLSILFVIVFGWVFGVLLEALVVSFTGAILRKYTGGAHSSSPTICVFVGTVVCVGFALLAKLPVFEKNWLVSVVAIITHGLAIIIIYKNAPVASENKPISEKRRPRMKRGGMILNAIYLLISIAVIGAASAFTKPNLYAFSICMSLGVLWQIFSITKLGETLLGAMDSLLSFKRKNISSI